MDTSPSRQLLASFERIPTPVISDALDDFGVAGALPLVRALSLQQRRAAGFARTARFQRLEEVAKDVRAGGGVGGPLEAVLKSMQSDDFVVIDLAGATTAASWGGLASRIALQRGVRGTAVNGGCRDAAETVELGYGVWSVAVTPRRSRNEFSLGELGGPLQIGSVRVAPGDVMVADDSGVVCIPAELAQRVAARCEEILRTESGLVNAIQRKDAELDWDQV